MIELTVNAHVFIRRTQFFRILILLILLSGISLEAQENRSSSGWGMFLNYYNEPALKPGVSFGLDGEFPLNGLWSLAVGFPSVTYFYFPYNYEAYYIYPEFSFRRVGQKGVYFGAGAAAGLSLSRKVVPVYNMEGQEIRDPFTKQLVLFCQLYFGYDFSRLSLSWPYKLYLSLGWKGLYPNNLGFQNQPVIQMGINYRAGSFRRQSEN